MTSKTLEQEAINHKYQQQNISAPSKTYLISASNSQFEASGRRSVAHCSGSDCDPIVQ